MALVATMVAGGAAAPLLTAAPADAAPRPVVYLTFDDGPGAETPQFLDLLARYGARATFFVTGRAVSANPATARRIVAEGHAIANHSWNHPRLTGLTDAGVRQELASTSDLVARTTGVTPTCYRPPYGATSARVHTQAVSVGLPNAQWTTGSSANHYGLWDVDTNDWRLSVAGTTWTEAAMRARLDGVGHGDTVLLHDGFVNRSRGLRVLGQWLADNHARFEFRALPGCGGTAPEPPVDPAHPEQWYRFQIARLYRVYFDRAPDEAGWAYWNDVHRRGRSLVEISDWFAQSTELRNAGIGSPEELVTLAYARVLGRSPDPGGAAYWLDQLHRGLTPGGLMMWFAQSPEYIVRSLAVLTGDCHDGGVTTSYRCWADRLAAPVA